MSGPAAWAMKRAPRPRHLGQRRQHGGSNPVDGSIPGCRRADPAGRGSPGPARDDARRLAGARALGTRVRCEAPCLVLRRLDRDRALSLTRSGSGRVGVGTHRRDHGPPSPQRTPPVPAGTPLGSIACWMVAPDPFGGDDDGAGRRMRTKAGALSMHVHRSGRRAGTSRSRRAAIGRSSLASADPSRATRPDMNGSLLFGKRRFAAGHDVRINSTKWPA
jgi:hypothetical protein